MDSQLKEIRSYCERRGYTLGAVYEDVMSGAKTDRQGYYELLQRIERGDAQVIVAFEVSRFGRNNLDNAWLVVKAKEYGLRLETVMGGRDFLADPESELLFDMLTAIAKFERRSIMVRMTRGKNAAFERGYFPSGRAPFGYDLVGPRGKKELRPNQWAVLVPQAFELARKGWGLYRVGRWLQKQCPGQKFCPRKVAYMIRNPVYLGFLVYSGKMVKGTHPALVTELVT